MSSSKQINSFEELGLLPAVLKSVKDNGYEQPSPIQAASIPVILSGKDILGQAQTGTGKTAAFALPILSTINQQAKGVQVLVLTPTRELAIQVAEAFQSYAKYLKDFHVLPIYGGQSYTIQLKHLKRGVNVVVGTPGRVMDHMRRKTLKLDQLQTLILDEADEMLRMGFIDDVDWILSHTPKERQIALFSATMPKEVKKVAVDHLRNPVDIKITTKTTTAKNINQRFWMVGGMKKLEALSRLLEVEDYDGVLIFVRTKMATEELAEKLQARGFSAEALNGDMVQKQRERLVAKLKNGSIDILIGTDVVARGLDVDRISHVVNYDIPYDTESYVHRIGRTGRAGRSGEAILFVSRREQRMLRMIEKATNQPIERMDIPSVADINQSRMQRFKDEISTTLATQDLSFYQQIITEFVQETDHDPHRVAAALSHLIHGEKGMLLEASKGEKHERNKKSEQRDDIGSVHARTKRFAEDGVVDSTPVPLLNHPEIPMERFVMAAGRKQGVKPTHVVGMICNEAELERAYVGQIDIYDDFTTVDLPADMPKEILSILRQARLCGRKSEMQLMTGDGMVKSTLNKSEKRRKKPATKKTKSRAKSKGKKKNKKQKKD